MIRRLIYILLFMLAPFASKAQVVDSLLQEFLREYMHQKPQVPETATVAVKTNLLYDLFAVGNIGVEVDLGKRWSAEADWFGTWFQARVSNKFWQGYGGYLTVRRYFGRNGKSEINPVTDGLRGHHIGAYGLGMTYDVEWGGRGYQAKRFGFGGGIEYGYSTYVFKDLMLDFTIGVGFQDGEYKEYLPTYDGSGHYVWQVTRLRHWWGPTKAEVTLKWIIGKKKKGGAR